MKRYRIFRSDFDFRANILNQTTEGFSKEEKALLQKQKDKIKKEIINEFGRTGGEDKIKRFKERGEKPFSIITYHNFLLDQIRNSYVQGAFYPALTSACTLGERILNHLILDLREEFKEIKPQKENSHPCSDCKNYDLLKQKGLIKVELDIYTCKSCSNWKLMIETLSNWSVINPYVKGLFDDLQKKRHKSIHFNAKLTANLEKESLKAIEILQNIIKMQFSAFFDSEYFINVKGEAYLKKELEDKPFFKKYYIPNCKLVTPFYTVKTVMSKDILYFIIQDIEIEDKEISDGEFSKRREEFIKSGTVPKPLLNL